MQQIDIQSSQDLNDSYSLLTFQEGQFIHDTSKSDAFPDPTIPTYQEVISTINAIRSKFPALSLRLIVTRLQAKFTSQQAGQQKKLFAMQCKYAAKSFVQLGYGISRMRKQISVDNLNLEISDAREYDRVINRVFLCAYRRLEEFITTKCQNAVKGETDMRNLLQVMRLARTQMGAADIHSFFKLLKVTYEDYQVNLSKTQACNLYKSIHRFIESRKRKGEGKMLESYDVDGSEDNDDTELSQQKWNDQMTSALLQLYIQDPSSLNNICSALKTRFPSNSELFQPKSIRWHLANIFKSAIQRVQEQMDYPPCLQMGGRFKRLQRLDEPRIKAILCEPEAVSVRTALCEFYQMKIFDINMLICTILSINEFVNKRQQEEITKNLQHTRERNSICREEYEFAGKRKKVLVFKKKKKPREKPIFE